MALVLVKTGEALAASAVLGMNLTLRLFVNSVTIDKNTVAGDLTEASGSGYAAKSLTSGSWVQSGGGPTLATYPIQTFTFTGALGNVYGYYVTEDSTGHLVWGENQTPADIAVNGDKITVTPKLNNQ